MFKPALQLSFCLSRRVAEPPVPEVKTGNPAFALRCLRSRTETAMKPASTAFARFRIPFSGTFARRSISGLRTATGRLGRVSTYPTESLLFHLFRDRIHELHLFVPLRNGRNGIDAETERCSSPSLSLNNKGRMSTAQPTNR